MEGSCSLRTHSSTRRVPRFSTEEQRKEPLQRYPDTRRTSSCDEISLLTADKTITMTPRRKESDSDADSSGKTSPDVSGADTFPCKAFQVIQYCEMNDPNVACWSRDGLYFLVKDTGVFSSSHLPRYFKHSNFQSFNRQLNIYGFRTVKEHDNRDGSFAFRHPFFQRERYDMLSKITRANKKQGGSNNDRFDEMQQQMDIMSDKLDLLISLVKANNGSSPGESLVNTSRIPLGAKRRRSDLDDSGLSQVSDKTALTNSESSSSSESSRKASLSLFAEADERGAEEQDALERPRESTQQELKEIRQNATSPQQEQEDSDFKMFIDEILGEGEDGDTVSNLGRQAILQTRATNMVWSRRRKYGTVLPSKAATIYSWRLTPS